MPGGRAAGISQRPLPFAPRPRSGRRVSADSERRRRRRRFARDVAGGPHPPSAGSAGTLGRRELPGKAQGSPAQQGMLGEAGVGQEWLEEGRSRFTAMIPLFGAAGTGKLLPAGRLTPWKGKRVSAWAGLGLGGGSWAGVGWGGFECFFRNTQSFPHVFARLPGRSPEGWGLLSSGCVVTMLCVVDPVLGDEKGCAELDDPVLQISLCLDLGVICD